eukprot:354422-Chlamydomonas_euryale.AAC.2
MHTCEASRNETTERTTRMSYRRTWIRTTYVDTGLMEASPPFTGRGKREFDCSRGQLTEAAVTPGVQEKRRWLSESPRAGLAGGRNAIASPREGSPTDREMDSPVMGCPR